MRAMAALLAVAVAVASSVPAAAGDGRAGHRQARRGTHAELYLDVPLDYSTDVIFPFGGSHHAVPGVVSVNRAPYRCLAHEREFRERMHFVAHLRLEHGLADDQIPAAVIVDHGQVVYLGE